MKRIKSISEIDAGNYLLSEDAALFLGIARSTLRVQTHRGVIAPTYLLGNNALYNIEVLKKYNIERKNKFGKKIKRITITEEEFNLELKKHPGLSVGTKAALKEVLFFNKNTSEASKSAAISRQYLSAILKKYFNILG